MNTHRDQKKRADVVDLDPYGTAAPFIDAAVSSVADGGMCLRFPPVTQLKARRKVYYASPVRTQRSLPVLSIQRRRT